MHMRFLMNKPNFPDWFPVKTVPKNKYFLGATYTGQLPFCHRSSGKALEQLTSGRLFKRSRKTEREKDLVRSCVESSFVVHADVRERLVSSTPYLSQCRQWLTYLWTSTAIVDKKKVNVTYTHYERRVRSWSQSVGKSAHRWCSHKCSGKLLLLSTRPVVTFPARECHCLLTSTKSYCLLTEGHMCTQLAQSCYLVVNHVGHESSTLNAEPLSSSMITCITVSIDIH